MTTPSKPRAAFSSLGALLLTAAQAAALAWYCDVYVNWKPRAFPLALAAVTLGIAVLTLLALWMRGERRATALLWKTALSALLFTGVILCGVSFLINNVIGREGMARLAASVAVPLAAAQVLALFLLLVRALRKNVSRRSALLTAAAPLLVAAVFAASVAGEAFYCVPQKRIAPVFPAARPARPLLPYDEGEFDMQDGDILVDPQGAVTTLAEAQDILLARGGDAPVTVWLKGGTYRFLTLFPMSRSNVTFRNVPGEEAVVTGAAEVTGWLADEANGVACWSVPWHSKSDYYTSLYHPDPEKQLSRPRYPAQGYLFVESTQGAKALFTAETAPWELTRGHTSFFAKKGDLRQFHALGDVTLRVLHKWKDEITNLVSYNDATRELVWQRPAAMTVEPGDRYFLENVFEELKEPGQWYLDREGGKLYYIPFEGEDMASTVLYAGVHERLLAIDGAENVTFRGITFRNTAWNMPDGTAWGVEGIDFPQAAIDVTPCVLVTNSAGISFEGCKFENIGATALKFGANVHDSSVTGCEFTNIGGNAVFIQGEFNAPNSGITVRNNLIAHYGRRFFNAIGVLNIHGKHIEIANNEIYDGYYTAISSGWVWGYSENPTDYVTIADNLIYQIGQGWLSDMGGIYCLGIQKHSRITGNVIHHVAADPHQGGYGGWGIYLDEGSTGQLVEKNLVYACGSQGFHQHYGKENLVRGNIFAFSGGGQIRVSRKEAHTSIILERNIIVSDKQPIYTSVEKGKFRDDSNLYFDYARPGRLFSGDDSRTGILQMRRMGYYQNALVADPLFRDAKGYDFTLALNSPVITKLGFEVWDYSRAGRIRQPAPEEPAGGILLNIDINSHRIPLLNSVVDSATAGTARKALRPFVAQYAGTQITDVLFDIFCQYSAAPSAVFTTETDKYEQAQENGVPVDYKDYYRAPYALAQWGVDAFEVWFAQCREIGLRPWISLRMNDCHEPDAETSFLRSDFFYEAREKGWMIGGEYGYFRYCFDYGVPEVREKMLAYIEEQLLRYDVDGLELDWMREITCFKEQGKAENIEIINEFMRQVDEIRQTAQDKWGHEIQIMCRMPRDYTQALLYGFDAAAWAKEGLVEAVVVTPRWESNDSAMPLDQWKAALADSVKIYAGLEILTNRASDDAYTTARVAKGYAAQYLGAGADAIYLFNFFQNPNEPSAELEEIYRTCGQLDTLRGAARRHIVTFQDIAPQGVEPFHPLPVQVTKTKPRSLLVHTGPVEAGTLTVYLGAGTGKLRVYLNGKPCQALGKAALPEQGKANYLPEETGVYAWRAEGPFPAGAQSVEIYTDVLRGAVISYVEIAVD